MKFRYKVLLINIIVLSIALGIVGFFMINKNFSLALEGQVKSAISENNLIQSTIEYELLNITSNSTHAISQEIKEIGESVDLSMAASESLIYIVYNGTEVFSTTETSDYPDSLWKDLPLGKKSYIITESGNQHYIYVSSYAIFKNKNINIITKSDITSVYSLLDEQTSFYKSILIIVLIVCSILMFLISYLLTKPISSLNEVTENFALGNFATRAYVHTGDEIGELATKYNLMADSVEKHIGDLKNMVVRQEQFVSNFTHEMKTPMTTIIGYADTIRSKDMPRETQINFASYIFNEGKRLENMSQKLFDFLYIKKNVIEATPISTTLLMNQVIDSFNPILEKNKIDLVTHIDECTISGDIDLLKSALINILDNARKASINRSKIVFSGKIFSTKYVISVQDFGIGIEQDELDKIFDEFYMVDKSRSRQEGGAGLGLSLTSVIINSHNATLDIKSKKRVGTTVTITFDICDTSAIDKPGSNDEKQSGKDGKDENNEKNQIQ